MASEASLGPEILIITPTETQFDKIRYDYTHRKEASTSKT
jgi:hypothetical protein